MWLGGLAGGVGSWLLVSRYFRSRNLDVPGWTGTECATRHGRLHTVAAVALFALPHAVWVGSLGVRFALPSSQGTEFIAAVLASITLPVQEEVIFRGVLFFGLVAAGSPVWLAAMVQALAFSLYHGQFSIEPLALQGLKGLAFSGVAWTRRSIWPALAVHAAWNLIEQARLILAGVFEPGSTIAQHWHVPLPSFVGAGFALVYLIGIARRQETRSIC
jgi:membrane protease YdiL (CAAX protease family)